MKIMIIAPDSAQRSALAILLEKATHTVIIADRFQEGYDLLPEAPCIVLADTGTDFENGCEFCRQVRAVSRESYVYLILTSAGDNLAKKVAAGLAAGADVVLPTQIGPKAVVSQINAGIRLLRFISGNRPAPVSDPNSQPADAEKPSTDKSEPETVPAVKLPIEQASEIPGIETQVLASKRNPLRIEDTSKYDRVLAKIAIQNKILNKKHLAEAFSIQKREQMAGRKTTLDEIVAERHMATPEQIEDLRTATKRRLGKRFGNIAVEKGFITREQVKAALKAQAEEYKTNRKCRRIGDILVDQKALTEAQRDMIWREQESVERLHTGPMEAGDTESTHDQSMPQLILSEDNRVALARVTSLADPETLLKQIKSLIAENSIRNGICSEADIMAQLETAAELPVEIKIAEGTSPKPGKDARVRYFFETAVLQAGRVTDDGEIDYRDRGERPAVTKGTLLAEKTPPVQGVPGTDVFGNPVPPPDVTDVQLKCEGGARLSQNGLQVHATTDGEPNVTKSGKISVFDKLDISGDVDYSTGNIRFDGNIHIRGAIKDGFRVSGGNISAAEINHAEIEASGEVVVKGGIIGATILAEGDVVAKYIENANIKAFGSVIVDKEVRDTKIRTSGEFISERGVVISSYIAAKLGVHARDIGTDVSEPCKIQLRIDENVRKRIQTYDFRINKKNKTIQQLRDQIAAKETEHRPIQNHITELAQTQDRTRVSLNELSTTIKSLQKKGETENLQQQMATLDALRKKNADVEKDLNNAFAKSEALETELAGLREDIEKIETEIRFMTEEKQAVLDWSKKDQGLALLKATGIVRSRSRIHGRKSMLVLNKDARRVTIKEVRVPDTENRWEMRIINDG